MNFLSKALLVLQRSLDNNRQVVFAGQLLRMRRFLSASLLTYLKVVFLGIAVRQNRLKWTFPVLTLMILLLKQEDIISIIWYYWISLDIFLRLLEPEATARARLDKEPYPWWEIESWQMGHLTFFYDTDLL